MAKSVLDVIIRTIKEGTGDKELVKGLTDMKTFAGSAGMAFGMLAGAAYAMGAAINATVGEFTQYADQVKNVSNLTGASAQEASRLIQVADDMKVSYEDLTKSLTAAVRDGMTPNIDGLAALSDEYVKLAPGAARASYLLDKFGKSGGEMAEMMERGGEAIRKMASEIDGGLILDPAALASAREYEKSIDDLSDAWTGVKMSVAKEVVPALTDFAKSAKGAMDGWGEMFKYIDHNKTLENLAYEIATARGETERWPEYIGQATAQLQNMALAEQAIANGSDVMLDAHSRAAEGMLALGGATDALSEDFSGHLGLVMNLQEGYDRFAEKEAAIRAEIEEVNAAFAAGSIDAATHASQISDLTGQLGSNATEMEEWSKKVVFGLVQARLAADGGISANEFGFLIALGEKMGIIDEKSVAFAQDLNLSFDSIDYTNVENVNSVLEISDRHLRSLMSAPDNKTITVNTDAIQKDDIESVNNNWSSFQTATSNKTLTVTEGNGGFPLDDLQDVLDLWGDILNLTDNKTLTVNYESTGTIPTALDAMQGESTYAPISDGGAQMSGGGDGGVGRFSAGGDGGKRVNIYGNVTVIAQGSVADALEELD